MIASPAYAEVWAAALPYMRARKNDVHIPLSYGYASRLVDARPEADADVVLLAILLHDIGWAVVDRHDSAGFWVRGVGASGLQASWWSAGSDAGCAAGASR